MITRSQAALLDARAMIAKCREAMANTPATSGDGAHSATSGDGAHSATSGYGAHSATSGNYAHSATSGNDAHSATSGDGAHSATSGRGAHSATSGDYAHSATSGYGAHSASLAGAAESAQAIAIGRWVRLGPDTIEAIVLPARGFRTVTIAADVPDSDTGEPWPVGVWITMADDGTVHTEPDVLLPDDGRGYRLRFVGGRYKAGCRSFTHGEAVAHWGDADHPSPVSAGMLLAEVERHHAANGGAR